jgi:hypothetical protein
MGLRDPPRLFPSTMTDFGYIPRQWEPVEIRRPTLTIQRLDHKPLFYRSNVALKYILLHYRRYLYYHRQDLCSLINASTCPPGGSLVDLFVFLMYDKIKFIV